MPPSKRGWRLTVEGDAGTMHVLALSKEDPRSIDDAIAVIRSRLRAAMAEGGCRSISFGVHVEGEACDHVLIPARADVGGR